MVFDKLYYCADLFPVKGFSAHFLLTKAKTLILFAHIEIPRQSCAPSLQEESVSKLERLETNRFTFFTFFDDNSVFILPRAVEIYAELPPANLNVDRFDFNQVKHLEVTAFGVTRPYTNQTLVAIVAKSVNLESLKLVATADIYHSSFFANFTHNLNPPSQRSRPLKLLELSVRSIEDLLWSDFPRNVTDFALHVNIFTSLTAQQSQETQMSAFEHLMRDHTNSEAGVGTLIEDRFKVTSRGTRIKNSWTEHVLSMKDLVNDERSLTIEYNFCS